MSSRQCCALCMSSSCDDLRSAHVFLQHYCRWPPTPLQRWAPALLGTCMTRCTASWALATWQQPPASWHYG